MKILLSVNLAWNVLNFRAGLIRGFVAAGHEVVVAVPPDEDAARVEALGCRLVPLPMDNGGTSVVRDLALLLRFVALLRQERPDVFLGYTVKPNVYGSLAARLVGIPVVNNIAGLGAAFINPGLLTHVVRTLYRWALRRSQVVFFQNPDDRDLFVADGLVQLSQTELLPGSGIDLARFHPSAGPAGPAEGCRFLLVARMLYDKGIAEYVSAARQLRNAHPHCRFELLGRLDVDNPAAITRPTMDDWVREGAIDYLGAVDDVRPWLARADCVVLPSYREGVPRTLLEAAAMAKPIVTTDAVGCREVVDDGVNGLLCKPRDADDLADKLLAILGMGAQGRAAMGQAGRAKVVREFDERIVIDRYLGAIRRATSPPRHTANNRPQDHTMRTASTSNRLSGDVPLSPAGQLRWICANLLEQWRDQPSFERLSFVPTEVSRPAFTSAKASPPRLWCDLFWSQCSDALIRLAGADLRMLDIGCGRGDYAQAFQQVLPTLAHYHGVDAFSFTEWAALQGPRMAFSQRRAEDIGHADIADRNLVVSTSALEHVADDLAMFASIQAGIGQRRMLQVHLIPGPGLWRDTGPHGYRGYSDRALRQVQALFPQAEVKLVALGGAASHRVHREWVFDRLRLQPRTRQDRRTDAQYWPTLTAAVRTDIATPTPHDPPFLALVIASNCPVSIAEAFSPLLR